MKKVIASLAAGVVASFGVVATAPAASADTGTCVTRTEYRQVSRGMTKAKVHRIFDIDGKRQAIARSGGYVSEIRNYKTCSQYSAVSIAWDKKPGGVFRLSAKSAVWVG